MSCLIEFKRASVWPVLKKVMTIESSESVANNRFESFIKFALNRKYEQVKAFLEDESFDINMADYFGNTVLHHAAATDNVELIEMLHKHPKFNVNIKNPNGAITPVMVAARNGSVASLQVLLKLGGSCSFQSDFGNTPLMIAINNGKNECIQEILNHGDFNIKAQDCERGNNSLMLSMAHHSEQEIVVKLLKYSDVTQTDSTNNTILHIASMHGCEDMIKVLFDSVNDIQVDALNDYEQTPLHLSILKNQFSIADFLIEKGANVLLKDKEGRSAFDFAAQNDLNGNFYKKYICPDSELENALRVAARNGNLNFVKDHVYRIQGISSLKPFLIDSARANQLECLKYLIALDAYDEDTMLEIATITLENRNLECFDYIFENYSTVKGGSFAKYNQEFAEISCINELTELFKHFITQEGVDPNGTDDQTYLMISSGSGYIEITKELLKYPEVDINRCHQTFGTALLLATTNGELEIVTMLLEAGADPSLIDESGFYPLLSAAYSGHYDCFTEILKYHHARTLPISLDGTNLLLAAAHSGNVELIKQCLEMTQDLQYFDSFGENCLHISAHKVENIDGFIFIVGAAKDCRSLLEAKNIGGETPLDLLLAHKDQSIVYSLIASYPEISDYIITSQKQDIEFNSEGDYSMCLICREDCTFGESVLKLPCSHMFHEDCFYSWSLTNASCPYCKRFAFKLKNRK